MYFTIVTRVVQGPRRVAHQGHLTPLLMVSSYDHTNEL
jgi:hypothetical protein